MTATISAQTGEATAAADELQVIQLPPTLADAQLITQMQIADALSGANRGWELLRGFETPPTLAQLKKRHATSSTEWCQIQAFLVSCETTATFVKHGLLNEALVTDLYWIAGAWRLTEKIVKGIRKEAGEPRLFENIEWLVRRAT